MPKKHKNDNLPVDETGILFSPFLFFASNTI